MMNEQQPLNFSDDALAAPQVEEVNSNPDWALVSLVRVVDRVQGFEMGVTLHVSGTVVSGLLISGATYFSLLAKKVAQGAAAAEDKRARKALADLFIDIGGTYSDVADAGEPSISYLHLRGASVFAPGASYALPETLWRGRLSQVSGWSLGSYNTPGPIDGT
ncbi:MULTISPECIES: hypothetical protein [Nocardiaceae]|uniref:hypothetical protein n=1 Tax=Nocardiaceae TaxID=85025 RepID=UPI000522FAC2|nr:MULTISPECIES: hypothetical protein [Rhodococcus]OZD38794.1 hypothetical protein CH284_06620 [Rhodococcus sp. 06-156-3]